MASRAWGLTLFGKLGTMGIDVTALADLRRPFELDLAGAERSFVALATGNGTMSAEEREFGF